MPKMKFLEAEEEFSKIEEPSVKENNEDYTDTIDWLKCGKLQVLGLTVNKCLDDFRNNGKNVTYATEEYHVVVKDDKTNDTYVIRLSDTKYGSYYADTCSQGRLEIKKATEKDFDFTYVPKEETFIDGFIIDSETLRYKQQINYQTDEKGNLKRNAKGEFLKDTDYFDNDMMNGVEDYSIYFRGNFVKNNVFTYSQIGYDKGHDDEDAGGYVRVNKSLFTPLNREAKQRQVWVVEAKSEKDVAYMTSQLPGFSFYDATSADKLPDKIEANVIVVNNQKFDLRDITRRIVGQPDIELTHVPASKRTKFILKQQSQNADKHNYTSYVQTPKIRDAFKRVEKLVKGDKVAPEKKPNTKSQEPSFLEGVLRDKKDPRDIH